MSLPRSVAIYEVGPRDGLQNVPGIVPTEVKIRFVDDLADAGLRAVEVTSFVSARWVPQLADGAAVMAGIRRREGVRHPVLVPNERGLEEALSAGAREIAVFTAASDEFNRRNVNATHDEVFRRLEPVARRAREAGVAMRGYVSTAFGCPFQGAVPAADVVRTCIDLEALGCAEISVGDTIGVADPIQVRSLVATLASRLDLARIALHLHDTYGRGLANAMAGLESGVTTFDTSAGGLGGCPYAPGATGNLATEDLCSLLERMGVDTGIDLPALVRASTRLAEATGLPLPSRALAALRAATDRSGCEGPT